jgi:hypothetical protein
MRAVAIVGAGYDRVAVPYLASNRPGGARDRYLERLLALLSVASDVLELGSGAGEPVTRRLAERHRVTAVGISAEQLRLPMFFSHFDAVTDQGLVQRAGFELLEAEVVEEIGPDGAAERFLWVIGTRLRGVEPG